MAARVEWSQCDYREIRHLATLCQKDETSLPKVPEYKTFTTNSIPLWCMKIRVAKGYDIFSKHVVYLTTITIAITNVAIVGFIKCHKCKHILLGRWTGNHFVCLTNS